MTAAEKIQRALAAIKQQRVEWLSEKPKVPRPSSDNVREFMDALRDEYRWYRDQRERLVEAQKAIQALIDECDLSMQETEQAAGIMSEIDEKTRQADQYADEASP